MAAQKTEVKPGALLAALGQELVKAHQAHQHDEDKHDTGGELPGGIDNGIAKLNACRFDKYKTGENTGKWYFYASAVVVEPKEFKDKDGVVWNLEGRLTRIMEPLCETPRKTRKTVDEHIAWVYNQLSLMGINREGLDPAILESLAAELEKAGPYIKFRTFKGAKQEIELVNGRWVVTQNGRVVKGPYPTEEAAKKMNPFAGVDPQTNQVWGGATHYDAEQHLNGDTTGVEDSTAVAVADHPVSEEEQPADEAPPEVSPDEVDQGDIDSLAARAAADDAEAQNRLVEMAVAAGHDQEVVTNPETSWDQVLEMIRNPVQAEPEPEPEPEPPPPPKKVLAKPAVATKPAAAPIWTPDKGKTCSYAPPDPADKTMKRRLKAVDCEITAVDPKTKLCTLKSLADGKTIYRLVRPALIQPPTKK